MSQKTSEAVHMTVMVTCDLASGRFCNGQAADTLHLPRYAECCHEVSAKYL